MKQIVVGLEALAGDVPRFPVEASSPVYNYPLSTIQSAVDVPLLLRHGVCPLPAG